MPRPSVISILNDTVVKISRVWYGFGVYLFIPVLVLLISLDVVLRYGFNAPLRWGNEVSALLLLLVSISTLPHCTVRGGHIVMDLLYKKFGPGWKKMTAVLSASSGLLFSLLLVYRTFDSFLDMYAWKEGAEMIDIPFWPFMLGVCLCGGLLTAHFALRLLEELLGVVCPKEKV